MNLNLYAGENSLDVELKGLKLRKTGAYINDASVTCVIKDVDGNNVTGVTFPITLTYDTGTDGNYSTVLSADSNIVEGQIYTVKVYATSGLNKGEWTFEATAEIRPFF